MRIFPSDKSKKCKSEFLYCSFIDKIYKYCYRRKNKNNKNFTEPFNQINNSDIESTINIKEVESVQDNNLLLSKFSPFSESNQLDKFESILQISDDEINTKFHYNINIDYHEISELSTCPLCLERLDTSASGITSIKTTSWIINYERWENYKNYCSVCSKLDLHNLLIKKDTNEILKLQEINVKSYNEKVYLNGLPQEEEKLNLDKNINNENRLNIKNIKQTQANNHQEIQCNICGAKTSLWICLICGAIGCDRYNLGHAVEHFEIAYHRYSIDMDHERIWDYKDDKWVHRVIKITDSNKNNKHTTIFDNENEDNTKNDSNNNPLTDEIALISLEDDNNGGPNQENLNTKEFLMRIENIICEYNFVLSEQLEQQRLYYEGELSKITEKNEEVMKNKINQLNTFNDKSRSLKDSNEQNNKMIKEYKKKLIQQEKKLCKIEENKNLTIEMMKNIKEDLNYYQVRKVIFFILNQKILG